MCEVQGRLGALAVAVGIGSAVLCTAGAAGADGHDAGAVRSAERTTRDQAPRSRPATPPRSVPHRSDRSAGADRSARVAAPLTPARTRSTFRTETGPTAAVTRPDPLTALFGNTAPRAVAAQTGQGPAGVVTGTLSTVDADGDPTGVAVTRAPAHGTVALGPSGDWTYTADPARAHVDYLDSFEVTTSDAGAGFHVHGLAGLLNLLSLGLLGAAGHSTTSTVRVDVGAFNTAPVATFRLDPPDPVTGQVTGTVLASDPNGDALNYTASAPAKGAVILTAAGEFSYFPTDQALIDGSDEFSVTVDDGYGATVVVPVTIALGSAPVRQLSTFCGCTLMPADTIFHADVRALPVLAQSQTWTALLGGTLTARWHTTPWMGSSAGMPVNIVGPDRPGEDVVFNRGYATTGPNIDDSPYAIPDFPLVEGMPDVPAWDRHLLVFQTGTCISQELYNVANGVELPAAGLQDALGNAIYATLYGSAWVAEAGVHVDMADPRYPAIGAANASKLPYLPMILRPDDLDRGEIDHMLGIAIAKDRGTGHTWPARSGDGTGTNPDGVPMGTVFRLRGDFDLSGYDPATQVVLRALQRHGAVVFDSFAAGRDGAGLLAMGNGWTDTDYPVAQQELSTIPMTAFEAVDVLGLAVDPAVGWQIRV